MNASSNVGNTSARASGGIAKTAVGIVIFILVVVGLYYLYNFLYGKNKSYDSVAILNGTLPMTQTVEDKGNSVNYVSGTKLTGILDAGQYSTSFWVYIADTKGFSNKLAHLMEISHNRFATGTTSKGNTLIFVGLNPKNGSLIVRQSTSDGKGILNNLTQAESGNYPLDGDGGLISGYLTSGDTYTSDDRCDILNGIEFQRWVLITVVGNGRTLDVYIDGKLARSCVYAAPFGMLSPTGSADCFFGLNNNNNLKGYFSNGTFYNYALSPADVWALYQAGPSGYPTIGGFFKNLFNVDVNFGTTAGMETA